MPTRKIKVDLRIEIESDNEITDEMAIEFFSEMYTEVSSNTEFVSVIDYELDLDLD
jgi:imidazoleglycerol phosphate dehydratase HisB